VFGEIDKKDRKTLVDVALRDMNIKRWIEFQAKSPSFTDCPAVDFSDDSLSRPDISAHLKRSIDVLEISDITKDKLKSAGFGTIQEVLAASVDDFKTLHYVGEKRADLVYNSVRASLYEYVT
jgi:DNA-directed RNA polymerase alpha subunit